MHLEAMPALLRMLVQAGSKAHFQVRPEGHYFAFTEHLWHLHDLEIEGYSLRIQLLLNEDFPALAEFDGDTIAKERRYIDLGWRKPYWGFCQARAANVARLRNVAPEDWGRRGAFHSFGVITLRDLVDMMRKHDAIHTSEILHLAYGCDVWKFKKP
jgi:hypothetical protein